MLICSEIFFIQLFFRMTFNGFSRQQKTIVNVIESVLNEFDKKGDLTGVNLLIDTGFSRFLYILQFSVKNFNGFKLKSPILDV